MNAHCERFNRTIQESFVDYYEDLLFTDSALFNQKMSEWLVFYNTELPHLSTKPNPKKTASRFDNTGALCDNTLLCDVSVARNFSTLLGIKVEFLSHF